ncbi:MAG: sensor histidine kinase [Fluviicola sp.]
MMFLLLGISSANNYFTKGQNEIPTVCAAIVGLTAFIVVRITKKYRFVGIMTSVFNTVIISVTFLFLSSLNYATPMWMVLNSVFTFFILNRIWGVAILSIQSGVFIYYILFIHADNLKSYTRDFNEVSLNFAIEFSIILLFFGYMLALYLSAVRKSEAYFTATNQLLNDKNELILKKNNESEVLLKEIHHRVKNNLQIISSLLRLQANSNPESGNEKFNEAINRVNAMAIIHERMYKTDMLSDFDLEQYLSGLIESLLKNYDLKNKVVVNYNVTLKEISSKSLVPVDLLLNELITNSIKHAFDQTENPQISIIVAPISEKDFLIEYTDNGSWKEGSNDSLGMEIVSAMTSQLEGTQTRVSNDSGTFYIFKLNNQV